jgi:hypothetical protein
VGLASRGWATLQPDAHGVVHIGDDFMLARTPASCPLRTRCADAPCPAQITFDCVPRPAFERQLEPLVTRCAALRTAQLLSVRAHWWGSHAMPPAWPWCMAQPSACVVHRQPMVRPA